MEKLIQRYRLELHMILSMLFLEIVFQFRIFSNIGLDFLYPFLFDLSFVFFVTFICHLLRSRQNKLIYGIILFLICLLFVVQIIYYDVFRAFVSFYSIFHGTGKVLGFMNDIIAAIIKNVGMIVLCFLPFLLFLILFWKKEIQKFSIRHNCGLIILALAFYLAGFLSLLLPHSGFETSLDYYLKNEPTEIVMQRFGVMVQTKNQFRNMVVSFEDHSLKKFAKSKDQSLESQYGYNVMDIDFDTLIQNETDEQIKAMHRYFKSLTPTAKNEYTGMFEGYNLIMITAEAFSDYAIDETLTPTLYKMKNEGFVFNNFYNPLWGVSTSDGEYVANIGLYPKVGVWSFGTSGKNAWPFTMGWQFQKAGVETFAYHNHYYDYYDRHLSHPNIWKNYKGLGNGLDVKATWPESDLEMIEKTSDEYMGLDRFHAYFMSVSGHMNYTFSGNMMSYKNYSYVKNLDLSDLSKGYLAANIEFDRAMERLLADLERYGQSEKTLIVISPDHYPYGLPIECVKELSKREIKDDFDLYKSALIIYSPSMEEKIEVDTPLSSVDILPTVNNLLGFEYDSRLLAGVDVFSDQKPIIALADHSFMNEEVKYDVKSGKVYYMKHREDDSIVKSLYERVNKKFEMSTLILEKDYYRKVIK